MNLKYYSILFSTIGIAVLYLIACMCKPVCIELSDIPKYEGKKIITKGFVRELSETQYKNQIIRLQNNNSSVKVFSEEKTKAEYGDLVEVIGKIQKYKDDFEIVVESKESITIIKKWNNITIPLRQIANNPENYIGLNVKVIGHIDDIYNSFFRLKELETGHTIIVSYEGGKNLYLKSGKEVIVKGLFSYDDTNLRYLLKVCTKNHGVSLRGSFD